jgi:hypothetical protein
MPSVKVALSVKGHCPECDTRYTQTLDTIIHSGSDSEYL